MKVKQIKLTLNKLLMKDEINIPNIVKNLLFKLFTRNRMRMCLNRIPKKVWKWGFRITFSSSLILSLVKFSLHYHDKVYTGPGFVAFNWEFADNVICLLTLAASNRVYILPFCRQHHLSVQYFVLLFIRMHVCFVCFMFIACNGWFIEFQITFSL